MDIVPSTLRKRKHLDLGHLSLGEKQCILNLYKEFIDVEPIMKITAIVSKIADTMGIAKSTVYRIIKEYRQTGKITSPKKNRTGRPGIVKTYGEKIKTSVREIVLSFLNKNEIPSLNKILKEIKSRQDLPKISRSSLHKLLKLINVYDNNKYNK